MPCDGREGKVFCRWGQRSENAQHHAVPARAGADSGKMSAQEAAEGSDRAPRIDARSSTGDAGICDCYPPHGQNNFGRKLRRHAEGESSGLAARVLHEPLGELLEKHRGHRLFDPWREQVEKGCLEPMARARDELATDTTERGARHRAAVAELCAADPPLALAYELKEAFRAAMAIGRSGDVDNFIIALDLFDTWCRASKLAPFHSVANSLRSWREETINYARSGGASNAYAEALNHLIKNQKRQAHGYTTWEGFRAQIIWTFGEVIDPANGEILPLRTIPRGQGARYHQP